MDRDSSRDAALSPSGMGFATACYLVWGLVPIYWKAIRDIPSDEALIPRILWTLILLLGATALTGKQRELRPAHPRDSSATPWACRLAATSRPATARARW